MSFKPAPGFVMAKPLKAEEVTVSGLRLPIEMTKRDANIAEVLEAGLSRYSEKDEQIYDHWPLPPLEHGDIIAYRPYTDVEVEEKFEKMVFVAYEQIVGWKKGIENATSS